MPDDRAKSSYVPLHVPHGVIEAFDKLAATLEGLFPCTVKPLPAPLDI